LQGVRLHADDFRVVLDKASYIDGLYVDPPYTVKHDNNGFRRYNERIFSWRDQLDLAQKLNKLAAGGAQVVVSNAFHKEVIELYCTRNFIVKGMQRSSCMAADTAYRGDCKELLLISRSIVESTDVDNILQGLGVRAKYPPGT
jgi:DNA adenine methylase